MFAILAIFSFIITLFLVSSKIIDLILIEKKRFKSNSFKKVFTVFSLFLWFVFSAILTIFISYILLQPPQLWLVGSQKAIADVALIEKQDCQKFIDTIYISENQIHKLENHRYIEESASLFTIKLEYQKGANKINSVAKQYLDLDVAENSQHYSQQLAQKLQQKAQLFEKRSKTMENSKGVKQIFNLLEQMDLVTKQRQNIIGVIEKQCNS